MSKGLEAITSPISSELRNGKQYYTYTKEDVEIIEKELKALKILINKFPLVIPVFVKVAFEEKELTKEEYELLKEVML